MQGSSKAHRAVERLTCKFVFKGQMAAERLWKPEPESKHFMKAWKAPPEASGGLSAVQGTVFGKVWPTASAVQVLALGSIPPHLWWLSSSGECHPLSLQEGLGVVRVDQVPTLSASSVLCNLGKSWGLSEHPVYEGRWEC